MFEVFDNIDPVDARGWRVRERGDMAGSPARVPLVRTRPPAGAPARWTVRELLHHVHAHEFSAQDGVSLEPSRINAHLLTVLAACHAVDTARRQLMSVLTTNKSLENVSHILEARVAAGLCALEDLTKLKSLLAALREAVEAATVAWEVTGRHFTRLTRLLPIQLHDAMEAFVPVAPEEIDRLAQVSLQACPKTPNDLMQLAHEGARRAELLVHAGSQAAHRFAQAREGYLQAVMEWKLAQFQMQRARSARQVAETGFRIGSRSVLEFAQATVEYGRLRNRLLQRESEARMARHTLYALASLLPEQFGLR